MLLRAMCGVAVVLLALASPARAQEYPTRSITLLVGLAPGGVTDVMARIYADAVSKTLGQKLIVENRAAAGGAVAAAALQNAQPDGYTLLLFSGSQHATIPAMEESAPYDPVRGAQPVALVFNFVSVVAVPANSPVKTLEELFAYGKQKPGGLTIGTPGVGSPSHLSGAKMMARTNTPVQFVHYRGGSPMMGDLIPGRLDNGQPSAPTAKPFLLDKSLRAVAVDGERRWSIIPDVPTLKEIGYGDASVASWFGVAASPGTPRPIIDKLNAAFAEAGRDPDVKRRIEDTGITVATSTPDEMAALMVKEAADIAELVRSLGLRRQ